MKLKQLLNDDDAVSPVIGVILMVAITVILAAVIATFVLGLGEQINDSAPNASFTFDYDEDASSGDISGPSTVSGVLTVTHSGGPNIDAGQLSISGDNGQSGDWTDGSDVSSSDDVSAGDSVTVEVNNGDRISVVWENEEGSESSTLQRFDVPE
jgi:flagellin-like protein